MTATTTQDTTSTPGTSTPSTPDTTLTQAPDPAAACPGLRAARARRTRAAIQTAALRLATEHGFDATTVEDVAAAAGVSRRTVFNYFPTKADMFVVGPHTPSQEEIAAFVASDGDLIADLARLLSHAGPNTSEDAALFTQLKVLVHNSPELIPVLQGRIRLFESVIHAAIAQRFATTLSDPRVIAAAMLASSLFKGAINLWSSAPDEPSATGQPQPASVPESIEIIATTLRELLGLPVDATAQSRPAASPTPQSEGRTHEPAFHTSEPAAARELRRRCR